MAIRGGKPKSIKSLRNSMKKGGGGQGLQRVSDKEPLVVRFLTEPDEWFEYYEHFDEGKKRFYVCTDNCPYCADDARASKRALASVVIVDEGKVVPLALPANLVGRLLNKYDKYNTMIDRDYELIRTGTGFDTEYDVTPEAPNRMKLDRFEVLDAIEILESMTPDGGDDDDEEDERPTRRRASSSSRKQVDEDDEDGEDEDEEFLRPQRGAKPKPRIKPKAGNTETRPPRILVKPKPAAKPAPRKAARRLSK